MVDACRWEDPKDMEEDVGIKNPKVGLEDSNHNGPLIQQVGVVPLRRSRLVQ